MRSLTVALCAVTLALTISSCEKAAAPVGTPAAKPEAKPEAKADPTKPATPPVPEKKPEPPSVTFAKKAPAVGDKWEEHDVMEMKMAMSMVLPKGPSKLDVSKKETTVVDYEVVTAGDEAASKAKVTFKEATDTETDAKAKDKVTKHPYAGKTYVLEVKGGKVLVQTEKGKPAPKKEADAVAAKLNEFGQADPVTKAMPAKAIKAGDEVAELVEAVKKELTKNVGTGGGKSKQKEDLDLKNVSVKLTEDKGEVGVFQFSATVVLTTPPMLLTMELKGEMQVRKADSRATLLKVSGPITVAGTDAKGPRLEGSGTMSAERTLTAL
jgi:hypothetical protein